VAGAPSFNGLNDSNNSSRLGPEDHIMNRLAVMLFALVAAVFAATAHAESWPDRPVKLIVPFPAGSSSDVVARILVQKLGDKLGQQIVVENHPGASGSIGADMIAKAKPDGYTMGLITGSTHAVSPALGNKLPYDPIKDFEPISMIGAAPYVLVVYPGVAAKNVKELVALAKSQPGKLTYGSAGLASLAHLAAARFAAQMGIELNHVPYKSSAQSVIDIVTGRLDMQFATIAPVAPNIRAGQLRAIATTSARRTSALPEVPTMIEAGVPGYDVALWMAFAMPSGTPDAIVTRLNKETTAILDASETQAQMRQRGFEPEPGPAAAVTTRIKSETETWRALITKTGIKTK
jgi:tripartite-type tricarboxylate transporter receptor subunit TctC